MKPLKRQNPEKSISSLLADRNSQSHALYTKAQRLLALNDTITQLLPHNLRHQGFVANLRDGVLVIASHNAAWGTRIRYEIPNLLSELRKSPDYAALVSIKIKILPEEPV